jgi:proline dehydrogenase
MLRSAILALSRSRRTERIATHAPGLRAFSRRFVAGTTQVDAIDAVRRLNGAGFEATVSFLGEAVTSEREVALAIEEFAAFAAAVYQQGLRSHLSVKLTELGLSFDRDLCARSLDSVLALAEDGGVFVRVDMEDSRYPATTLELIRAARARHQNIGAVIQAYLYRSSEDVVALSGEGVPVRLVKGAYREPPEVAYQAKREVDAAFVRLTDSYFAEMTAGSWLAVATHDRRMIDAALESASRRGVARDHYEFQMLYGIRTDLQRSLRDAGHLVRVYVPYGSHWYPYLMRRLAERPANLWFFLRHALR